MKKNKESLPKKIDNMNNSTFTGFVLIVISGLVSFLSAVHGWQLHSYIFVITSFLIGIILVIIGQIFDIDILVKLKKIKIARGCISWIYASFFPGLILLLISQIVFDKYESVLIFVSMILFILTVGFLVFFRDPERNIGKGIVAVADGKIREISELTDKDVGKSILISTFMNVHNVHVNRMPFDGKIIKMEHKHGFHLPAFKKESEKNERTIIIIDSKIGIYKIVLIAGTLARRIVPYVKKNDTIKKGERIGIIRLGSRVDIYLPKKSIKKVLVEKKDRVIAGKDSIAEIND